MQSKLILLRHGESAWNKENRFTGWTDVPLSGLGETEAKIAGKAILDHNLTIDTAFTSVLKRAINTCNIVLDTVNQSYVPVTKTWRLNERHYGRLQGLNKSEVAAKHGEQQVKIWRRSYDVAPPALDRDSSLTSDMAFQYQKLPKDIIPVCESLKDTIERVLPFWYDNIAPSLLARETVLVTAHGNSLRGLVKHLKNLTEEEVLGLDIPTGVPLVFELDENLKPLQDYYLLDENVVKSKIDAVASQASCKN